MNIRIITVVAATLGIALPALAQDRDALDVQKARNAHVGRKDLVDYPANQFDLSNLPSYKPEQQVSGVIRMTGSNYIADSHVGENWVAAFKKFQPGVTFEFNLKTPSVALYALILDAGDVDPSRKMTFEDLLAYERTMNADPVEIEYATGSYDVPAGRQPSAYLSTRRIRLRSSTWHNWRPFSVRSEPAHGRELRGILSAPAQRHKISAHGASLD